MFPGITSRVTGKWDCEEKEARLRRNITQAPMESSSGLILQGGLEIVEVAAQSRSSSITLLHTQQLGLFTCKVGSGSLQAAFQREVLKLDLGSENIGAAKVHEDGTGTEGNVVKGSRAHACYTCWPKCLIKYSSRKKGRGGMFIVKLDCIKLGIHFSIFWFPLLSIRIYLYV